MMMWTVAVLLALGLTLIGVNSAFYLMRQASDIAVFAGLSLLIGVALLWASGLTLAWKRIAKTLAVAVVGIVASGCSERIQPGYVGIVVNEWGEDRGVDSYPVQTGRIWYNPVSTSVLQYPYFMQTHELTDTAVIVVNDRDGLRISFPLGVGYTLIREQVPGFYVKFRTEDIAEFTRGFYKNAAQAAFNAEASKLTAEQIYGAEKQNFVESARSVLNKQMQPYGVNTEQFSIIGDMALPEQVIGAINAKIQATQRAQQAENELRETRAEAEKVIAQAQGAGSARMIAAEADAKANRTVAASLTPELLHAQWIHKWNGAQPSTVAGPNTSMFLSPAQR
jgi:regulator of protease activity HflC (stomatin/prohibitin superfamily)